MQPPWLAEVPFTLPFELFAHTGKLWIQNDGAATQDEFLVKGINWAGFQQDGCPQCWRAPTRVAASAGERARCQAR